MTVTKKQSDAMYAVLVELEKDPDEKVTEIKDFILCDKLGEFFESEIDEDSYTWTDALLGAFRLGQRYGEYTAATSIRMCLNPYDPKLFEGSL